jgi:sigma-B regulation protein RsbU (phosphoserine phosphatase)
MIAIGDVAGKGISACLYSIALRSTLRSLAEATNDLSQLARQANDLFLLDVKESGFFATLWIGICDGRHLSYASFGHPPALLKQGKEIVELSTGHPAFGIDPFRRIETGTTVLEAGDTLLLYTDGVTEAHDPNGKLFGMNRLKEVLLKQSKPSPEPILQEIVSFSQGAPQHDDIAILLLHVP